MEDHSRAVGSGRAPPGGLYALADDVWVATHKLRFYGTPVVARMTVLRLDDGGLLLHSPVPRTQAMEEAVLAQGPVRFVLAPNRYHHLWAGEWAALPGARLCAAKGVAKKRRDLCVDVELTPDAVAPEAWRDQIDTVVVAGMPILNEVALFHRRTRTLIVSDLFFNYKKATRLSVRLVRKLEDCDGKFVVPRLIRLSIRDKAAFRASMTRLLALDFDRLIMAHGDVVQSGARALVEAALASLR